MFKSVAIRREKRRAVQMRRVYTNQDQLNYRAIIPTPASSAVAMQAATWKEPNDELECKLMAPLLDVVDEAVEEAELEPPVAVIVPVPAVPASFICVEQVPVALVVALTVADPSKLQASAARSCST